MSLFKHKKIYILFFMFFILIIGVIINIRSVKATGNIPNLTITYDSTTISETKTTSTDIKGTVSQEIEVKYKVTPDDLSLSDVNALKNKEIVLVLDTSGSMSNSITGSSSRIAALKTAANNFINKFSGVKNVKIGIATYSTEANYDGNSIGLTSTLATSDVNKLITKVNNLNADGGTNIGDGIRYATKMLQDSSDTTAKKYLILMSDGEPTFYAGNKKKPISTNTQVWNDGYYTTEQVWHDGYYSTEQVWHNRYKKNGKWYDGYYTTEQVWHNGYYAIENVWHDGYYTTQKYPGYEYYTGASFHQEDDPYNLIIAGGGNSDPDGRSLGYAENMISNVNSLGYSSYEIAYSSGSSADKMKTLATMANGKFVSALDATAIDNVFSEIADQIKADYTVESINFNFSLLDGVAFTGSMADVTINGSTYSQQLPNLVYRLNTDKTKYVADPFYITFKVKVNKSGVYNLAQGFTFTYKGIDGKQISKEVPQVTYTVSKLDIGFNLSRSIVGYSGQATAGQTLQMNYSIQPNNISVTNTKRTKQVVLLVDSSYTKKDDIKSFLSQFNNINDVYFSLVTYDTGAVLSNFGTEAQPSYFVGATNSTLLSRINSITSSTGSNLGEGLRKALFALNNTQDVDRRIVIFGENNPNYYSYTKAEDGTINYYEELDNNIGSLMEGQANTLTYGTDTTKAEEYTKLITQKIIDTKDLAISVISSGDGINDDVLNEVSSIASTEFNKLSTDVDITKLKNIVNSDLIINARVYEVLPSGINFEDKTSTLNKGIKIFYNYDNTNKYYVGIPVGVSVNMIPNEVGNLNLNNSKLYYTDLEGFELNKSFDNLALNIVTSYDIKQGMFFKQQSDKGSKGLGESYITNYSSNDKSIAINSSLGMGALIKTSGQSTTVSIDVNSSNLSDINISNISPIVYKVNKDNTLTPTSVTPTITNNGNMVTLTFLIPTGELEETYYLINYNYRIGTALTDDEFNTKYKDGLPIENKCYIGSIKTDTYSYSIVGLPDLF